MKDKVRNERKERSTNWRRNSGVYEGSGKLTSSLSERIKYLQNTVKIGRHLAEKAGSVHKFCSNFVKGHVGRLKIINGLAKLVSLIPLSFHLKNQHDKQRHTYYF